VHYLSAPVDTLFERIQQRKMERPPIRRDQLMKWSEAFQAPTLEELELFDKPSIGDA
jgi:hypothetical protein